MTIDEVRASFDAHLDGELGPEDVAAFEDALRNHPELAAEWEAYQNTVNALRQMPAPKPPSDLMESTSRRWRRRQRLRYYEDDRGHRYRLELALCVLLVIALIAVGGLSSLTSEELAEPRITDGVQTTRPSVPLAQWLVALGPVKDVSTAEIERFQLELPSVREGAFRATLLSYPDWTIESRASLSDGQVRYILLKKTINPTEPLGESLR